jgi:L-threonylcarbamoyladenylate synthase
VSERADGRALSAADAHALEACVRRGGVAVIPTDTLYGVCCDPESEGAVRRMYALKRRPPGQASAVMFFDLSTALAALGELDRSERSALAALLPGPVTVLLENRARRFALACGADPAKLGLRVPALEGPLAALTAVATPVLQSSANLAGGREARRLRDVAAEVREGADLLLDGGELAGVASTIVDLSAYARTREWAVVREGARTTAEIGRALGC